MFMTVNSAGEGRQRTAKELEDLKGAIREAIRTCQRDGLLLIRGAWSIALCIDRAADLFHYEAPCGWASPLEMFLLCYPSAPYIIDSSFPDALKPYAGTWLIGETIAMALDLTSNEICAFSQGDDLPEHRVKISPNKIGEAYWYQVGVQMAEELKPEDKYVVRSDAYRQPLLPSLRELFDQLQAQRQAQGLELYSPLVTYRGPGMG